MHWLTDRDPVMHVSMFMAPRSNSLKWAPKSHPAPKLHQRGGDLWPGAKDSASYSGPTGGLLQPIKVVDADSINHWFKGNRTTVEGNDEPPSPSRLAPKMHRTRIPTPSHIVLTRLLGMYRHGIMFFGLHPKMWQEWRVEGVLVRVPGQGPFC